MSEQAHHEKPGMEISRRAFVTGSAASIAGMGMTSRTASAAERGRGQGRRWRVGVIGLGHWYSAYGLARSLTEYPQAELVACAWRNQAQLQEFTGTFGIAAHREYAELLARPDIDIVHIAPPVSEIPELTIAAARAGKHIILGKPLAMTLAQADAMVSAVEAAGVVCVPFQAVARLGAMGLKHRLDRGDIGELVVFHQASRWSIAEDWMRSGRPGWFADPAHVPGGALIDEGIYGLELALWLAGAEPVEVIARTANFVHRDIAVEDWGMATYTFDNGVIATLEGSWTINAPQRTAPSPKQNSVVRSEIIGTRGEIVSQQNRDPGLGVLAAGAQNWVFERTAGEPFLPATPFPLHHLIECIEQDRQPIASIRDARKSFAMAMAAYDSARAGQPVRFRA
jgi:predicted dehydrogenase